MTTLTAPGRSSSRPVEVAAAPAPTASGAGADCPDHDWTDTYPMRECERCGAREEAPEPDPWKEDCE